MVVVGIIVLIVGAFVAYWLASADARVCDEFRDAVMRKASRAGLAERVAVDLLFDAGWVEIDGQRYEKPEGCEAEPGTRFEPPTPRDA